MDINELKKLWQAEEQMTFEGWDFSYISQRTTAQDPPWDYKRIVTTYMNPSTTMLDMGTGGGEFLVSLAPPEGCTYATEAYPPNVELCQNTLPRHGIEVRQVFRDEELPFEDSFFDLVINRHESFSSTEVFRILKPRGLFVTQQVGGRNNRDLSKFLLGNNTNIVHAEFNLEETKNDLMSAGFSIMDARECFLSHQFHDIGALVYYAKIIEWEFPDFSVDRCFNQLCLLQDKIERDGFVQSNEHRFLIKARKS